MSEDRTNYEALRAVPKYCPHCDPEALYPVIGRLCTEGCGTCKGPLCVVTEYSGTLTDEEQFTGTPVRYAKPVTLVTSTSTW